MINYFHLLKKFKYWYLSYNNQSYPNSNQLLKLLKKYSNNIKLIKKKHVYKITGKNKKQTNTEYLFIIKKMINSKKRPAKEIYEDYCSLTLEYTNFKGQKFF